MPMLMDSSVSAIQSAMSPAFTQVASDCLAIFGLALTGALGVFGFKIVSKSGLKFFKGLISG